jgi:hypothetical protein
VRREKREKKSENSVSVQPIQEKIAIADSSTIGLG